MAAPLGNRLQNMLQSAVQSVQWTYSLFWQVCPQEGILVWGDGYYNGAIKTRKTIQSVEVTAEEASLQRSQQLRELYDSLATGDMEQPPRRPCAALSPEDLTESEWFYLICVSFSFAPASGLPGKAYAKRQHVWLSGANESDSKIFTRAILAKSARIQTVVCIPMLDGVIELGTTERVEEDLDLIQHVRTFFTAPHQPKPALSGHSTSNPATYSRRRFRPPEQSLPAGDIPDDEVMVEEEEEEEEESDSEGETGRDVSAQNPGATEPSELIMQFEMSEDIQLGSPEDASNNFDPGFHVEATDQHRRVRNWPLLQQELSSSGAQPQPPVFSGGSNLDELSHEESHYNQTVSTILQNQPSRWADSASFGHAPCSVQSAFAKWEIGSDHRLHVPPDATSQNLLKYVLFSVPFLHYKNSPKSSRDVSDAPARFRRGSSELSANHVLAERRRREKLNELFLILRSLVPFVTKSDKSSILGDTIEYLKHLLKKIKDLETRSLHLESEQRSRSAEPQRTTSLNLKEQRSGSTGITVLDRTREKRKLRIVEGNDGGAKAKTVDSPPSATGTSVQVSIIESDALVEMQCPYREGLLLDVMATLKELRVEITTVQSSLNDEVFQAEMRAKVKENGHGKRTSILEVKKAMYQIIPHSLAAE